MAAALPGGDDDGGVAQQLDSVWAAKQFAGGYEPVSREVGAIHHDFYGTDGAPRSAQRERRAWPGSNG